MATVERPEQTSPAASPGLPLARLRGTAGGPGGGGNLGRLVDILVLVLIVGYTVALMPGLTRWPPLINDEGREANLFWVASGADPTAERMNAFRGFATW